MGRPRLARASGALKSKPCDGLRLPKAAQMEPIFLSADQIEVLARATRPPYDLLVRVVAATGLRPSETGLRPNEVCGLRVGKVNLLRSIQERLGHNSITVTMDVYGHLFPALNEALTERLDEVFRSGRTARGPAGSATVMALPESR